MFHNIDVIRECESALPRIFSRSCSCSLIAEPFQDPQEDSWTFQQPWPILISSVSATMSLPARMVHRDRARPRGALASGAVFARFVRVVAHLYLVTFCESLLDGWTTLCLFLSRQTFGLFSVWAMVSSGALSVLVWVFVWICVFSCLG